MKPKKGKQKIFVTERDRVLFLYLFQNKIANFEQIREDVFGDLAMQTVYARLGKLRQTGFIKRTSYLSKRAIASGYFHITQKCLDEYLKGLSWVKYSHKKVDVIEHDLRLNDIKRFFLKKKLVRHFFAQNELFARLYLRNNPSIPKYASVGVDAVVGVRGPKGKLCHFGLEYEHTLQTKPKCRRQVRNYYFKPNMGAILFIYNTQNIYERFMKIDKQTSKDASYTPKLFFLSIQEILSGKEVTFENINRDKITIK